MRAIRALTLVVCLAAMSHGQIRLDHTQLYEVALVIVPLTGAGTDKDPRRPALIPGEGQDRLPEGLVSWSWQAGDDDKVAILEIVARNKETLRKLTGRVHPCSSVAPGLPSLSKSTIFLPTYQPLTKIHPRIPPTRMLSSPREERRTNMTRAEASRLNGAKSRGPVTEEGKQRSSLNALRHGLTAAKDKAFVCQNEDQAAWDSIYEDFVARFAPIGPVEHDLIAELTQARWRLRRSSTIETGVLDHEMDRQSASLETRYEQVDECSRISLAFEHIARNNRTIDVLSRYEARARRGFERTLTQLTQLQNMRRQQDSQNAILPNEPETTTETRSSILP